MFLFSDILPLFPLAKSRRLIYRKAEKKLFGFSVIQRPRSFICIGFLHVNNYFEKNKK
jgi:hypothetical protein